MEYAELHVSIYKLPEKVSKYFTIKSHGSQIQAFVHVR